MPGARPVHQANGRHRPRFATGGFAMAMLLVTPLSRLPVRRQRVMVGLLAAVAVCYFAVLPFLWPALVRGRLLATQTNIDPDGVCLQATGWTCGPAAAVTALRRLGLPAEEGEIAILAHTSPAYGTQADELAAVLSERYGAQGLAACYRHFADISELPRDRPTIAVIKLTFLVDHFVCVLSASDQEVVIGDPIRGRQHLTPDAFRAIWRFTGIVLRLQPGVPVD